MAQSSPTNDSLLHYLDPLRDPDAVFWTGFCGNQTLYNAFWSLALTWNTDDPDLTNCFQDVVLTCTPSVLILLGTLPYCLYLKSRRKFHNRRSTQNWTNIILGSIIALLSLTRCILGAAFNGDHPSLNPAFTTSQAVQCLGFVIATGLSAATFRRGIHSSGLLSIFWALTLLINIIPFRSSIIQFRYETGDTFPTWKMFIFYFEFAFVLVNTFVACKSDVRASEKTTEGEYAPLLNSYDKSVDHKKDPADPSPFNTASFFSRMTFAWLTTFLVKGFRRPSRFEHLYQLRECDTTEILMKQFSKCFGSVTHKNTHPQLKSKPMWYLFKSLMKHSWIAFLLGVITRSTAMVFQFLNPQILRLIIGFLSDMSSPSWHGILFASFLFINNAIDAVCIHWWVYYGYIVGQRVRSLVNSLIYKKAIRLSSIARRSTSVGEVVNLMAIDAQKLQDCPQFLHILWSFPVVVALATYFLYQTLGPAAFASIPLLVLLLPFNSLFLGNKIRVYQEGQMILKDERVKIMNEILSGIKVLKFYAWEPSFLKKTLDVRDKELKFLQKTAYCNGVGSILWFLSPYLVTLAVFAVYVCTGEDHVLTPDKAFVSLSLINILNFPIALLPLAVSSVGQGIVSMKRIAKFLLLDEIEQEHDDKHEDGLKDDEAVRISNSTSSWGNDEPVLKDISLSVQKGELVAIVGQVGAGKSSLLSSILGEMVTCSGSIKMKGKLAYVPQQAWIQNASLKDNILFGHKMADSQYKAVVGACALEPDLKSLPGGDAIEIGERGINLSGGQKQRVSLARAVYQDADLYLLDDPLSAVDANVGQHIFQQVIGPEGLLRNKTRILNTHGIAFLPHADQIVVMKDGRVSEIGTYADLMTNQGAFADFVTNFSEDSKKDGQRRRRCSSAEGCETCFSSDDDANKSDSEARLMKPRLSSHRSTLTPHVSSIGGEDVSPNMELISEESAETGNVSRQVIWTYIKAGTLKGFSVVLICHIVFIVIQVMLNIWLSEWTNEPIINGTMNQDTVKYRLGIYGVYGILQVIFVSIQAAAIAIGSVHASGVLHSQVLHRILQAPMSFFDTTPLGRILNRFSKDLDILDTNLPTYIRFWLFDIAPLCATICIIAYTTPIFLVLLIPVGPLYLFILRVAVANINQLRRLDSMRRSPIYAHFDESLVGLTSIRAYKKEEEFMERCDQLIDNSQRAWFLYHVTCRWIGVWVEIMGSFLVFIASLLAIVQRESLSPGLASLSITYSLQLILFLNVTIRASAELETYIVSVERIKEYTNVPQEALWDVPETKPPKDWPKDGKIVLKDYCTRYRPGLDLVLKRISCEFHPKERVGIVGRTGAGKSSLTLSLFRIIEAASGSITIDDVAIHGIGLHDLRKGLTIIPQDPVLFSGPLRQNLDPFQNYTEVDMWTALEHAHLKQFVKDTANGLEYDVGDGGESLSIGQRQLVCLARALLHKTRVLILDEATAAVDMETDELIQATIRSRFTECTIITIAHRLNTVLDYDRIVVLDQGKIVEMDSPANLLRKRNSLFWRMAKDAGIS